MLFAPDRLIVPVVGFQENLLTFNIRFVTGKIKTIDK